MFESRENTIVSAAILCAAVWISDVINKARVCGENIQHVTSCSLAGLYCSIGKERTKWLRPEELRLEEEEEEEKEKKYLFCIIIDGAIQ